MKIFTSTPTRVILPLFVFILLTSCTKDSDLLAEYVIEESITSLEESEAEQSNNPPAEEPQETATVDNNGWYQVLFTEDQVSLMINRMESGYSRPGTNGEDIERMIDEAASFLSDPYTDRLDFMTSNPGECWRGCDPVPTNIVNRANDVSDNIFYAGWYAFLLSKRNQNNDLEYAQSLANAIALQTLARASDPNLNFKNRSAWRIEIDTNPYFITCGWLEKTLHNWSLIKNQNLVSNLTEDQETQINGWLKNGRDWAYGKLNHYYSDTFGSSWQSSARSTGWNKINSVGENPIFAVNGVRQDSYTLNHAAAAVTSNIASKYASFLHAYGLVFNDQQALDLSERWFEDVFKLAVFPDGTSYELNRAKASDPGLGLHYWAITMGQLTSMAHTHAVSVLSGNPATEGQSFSKFYDYRTSEGLSDYLPSHAGSDTKGGSKGLESFLVAFAKYIGQSTSKNEWGEVRQVNASPYPIHQMTDKYHYFVPVAQANAYYQNSQLKNLYSGTGGYQAIKTRAEGAVYVAAWRESYMGGFGKTLAAFPYLETEGLYTGNLSP